MRRIRRNWKLAHASWAVLVRHWRLFVFPLMSWGVVATLAGVIPVMLVWIRIYEENEESTSPVGTAAGFVLLYLLTCTVVQCFNVALVTEVIARFDGLSRATPSGWSVVRSEFRVIVAYAVLSSTVVSISIFIACRVGRMIGWRGLPSLDTWSLATFLGVPVIAAERLGIRDTLARSADLLRATWGDKFVGSVGILVVRILVTTVLIVAGVGIIILSALTEYEPFVLVTALLVLATIQFVLVTGSAIMMIYCAATYRHCTNQPVRGFEALNDLPRVEPMAEPRAAPVQV